jgi:hypothetical protein
MSATPKLGTKIHGMHVNAKGATCLDYSGEVVARKEQSFTVEFSDGSFADYWMSTKGDYWKTDKGSWK